MLRGAFGDHAAGAHDDANPASATTKLAALKGALMAERWRGIFTILLTPFREDRALDEESLRSEVDFVITAARPGLMPEVAA